ncbi:MAG: hypothetical protein GY754_21890 [bacterium]|nr:hypothetical protein [bacterium]
MNTKPLIYFSAFFLTCFLSSCGTQAIGDINLAGTVDFSEAPTQTGPAFIIISNTDDFDKIENDPMNSVISMVRINDSGTFSINLSELGVQAGDIIYLVAFIDNDYTGSVPYPTEGDYVGFYIQEDGFSTGYEVSGETVSNLTINVNRQVYDFEAAVSGTINGSEAGEMTVIAYTGAIESLDFSSLDTDSIIGYKRLEKPAGSTDYTLKILPYGTALPVEKVYIIGFIDKNGNGSPDGGDQIGYYLDADGGVPKQLTISEGTLENINVDIKMAVTNPSGYTMSIAGSFNNSTGTGTAEKPIFIIVANGDDPSAIFSDPVSAIKEFQKLAPGENTFDINLSNTDLVPGDQVMVIALWDRDYAGGFPNPTTNADTDLRDKVGFYQNTDVQNFELSVTLTEGVNTVSHNFAPNGSSNTNYQFNINKYIYDYATTVQFQLDPDERDRAGTPSEDHNFIIVVCHQDGVSDGFWGAYSISDLNYVIAMSTLPYKTDEDYVYEVPILNAIDDRVSNTTTMPVYVYVIYDHENPGETGYGIPSTDDPIAAYWENNWIKGDVPLLWTLESNTTSVLLNADGDSDNNPYGVKFLGREY